MPPYEYQKSSKKRWTVTDGTRTYTFIRNDADYLVIVECEEESVSHSIE